MPFSMEGIEMGNINSEFTYIPTQSLRVVIAKMRRTAFDLLSADFDRPNPEALELTARADALEIIANVMGI